LFQGDVENDWRSYEWRWKNAQRLSIGIPRNFTQPLWLDEESSAGNRFVLFSETGLGDTLQFFRYAALSAAEGAIVFLEVADVVCPACASFRGLSGPNSRPHLKSPCDAHHQRVRIAECGADPFIFTPERKVLKLRLHAGAVVVIDSLT
jgi:hypothetical protein